MNSGVLAPASEFGVADGPIRAGLAAALREAGWDEATISLAPRSPVGPHALKVQPTPTAAGTEQACAAQLGAWLAGRGWVEAVAARGPRVYVQLATDLQCDWAALTPRSRVRPSLRPQACCALLGEAAADTLAASRAQALSRSLAALLGCRAEPLDAERGRLRELGRELAGATECAVAIHDPAPAHPDQEWTVLPVAGVDVPQGPLRARHGGMLTAADLLHEVSVVMKSIGAAADSGIDREPVPPEAAARYLLIRAERSRRIEATDSRLRGELQIFAPWTAHGCGGGRPAAGEPTVRSGALRAVLFELEQLPTAHARSVGQLEPSLLTKQLRAVRMAAAVAAGSVSSDHRVWPLVAGATHDALRALGLVGAHSSSTAGADPNQLCRRADRRE